jgi:hypothetical protein
MTFHMRRTVVVVLADEDDGQVPQASDVECLEDLPLVGRAVAVPGTSAEGTSYKFGTLPPWLCATVGQDPLDTGLQKLAAVCCHCGQ